MISLEQLGRALDTEDCAIWVLRGPDGRSRRMFGWPENIDGAAEGSLLQSPSQGGTVPPDQLLKMLLRLALNEA